MIPGGTPVPYYIFIMSFAYQGYNGYMQGSYLTRVQQFPQEWLSHPCFMVGFVMFFLGMIINVHSDHLLRNLRKPGETGYKIPRGGMFEYVSGANFLGEIIEWAGFAVACWSLPAFAFAAIPRAC